MTEEFRDAIRVFGLQPPDVIEPGRMHRFATNGRRGDDADGSSCSKTNAEEFLVIFELGSLNPGIRSARHH